MQQTDFLSVHFKLKFSELLLRWTPYVMLISEVVNNLLLAEAQ